MSLETLQITYYSMAIVFMALIFLGLLTIIILGFYIWMKVSKLQRQVEETIEEFRRNPSEKAAEVIMNVGAGVASAGAKKIQEVMDKKRAKK